MRRAKQRSALAYALQVIACAAVAALCVRKLFGSVAQRLEDSSTTQAAGNISAKVFAENITKIISAGIPRAGSTFQHVLLCVLANLRASNVTSGWGNPVSPGMVSVDKAHPVHTRYDLRDNELLFLSVRSSVDDWAVYNVTWSRVSYVQIYDVFITCPLCEVENYAKFFNLSNEEILQVRQYMRYWSILRQCCGFQQSKRKRQVLHGCGDFSYHIQGALDYHDCFSKNLSAVEHAYVSSLLFEKVPARALSPSNHTTFHWQEVGDCDRIDVEIQNGLDFNKANASSCP